MHLFAAWSTISFSKIKPSQEFIALASTQVSRFLTKCFSWDFTWIVYHSRRWTQHTVHASKDLFEVMCLEGQREEQEGAKNESEDRIKQ